MKLGKNLTFKLQVYKIQFSKGLNIILIIRPNERSTFTTYQLDFLIFILGVLSKNKCLYV